MRIGFDVSQTAENKAGCGFVADQLIRALVQLAPQHEYLLYPSFYGYQAQDPLQATCPDSPQVRLVNLKAEPGFDDYDWWRRRGVDRSEKLGYPAVVKTAAAGAHKTESGGIALDLDGPDEVHLGVVAKAELARIQKATGDNALYYTPPRASVGD